MNGIVRLFDRKKCYGFIDTNTGDGKVTFFVHRDDLQDENFLCPGDEVSFEIKRARQGTMHDRAMKVVLIKAYVGLYGIDANQIFSGEVIALSYDWGFIKCCALGIDIFFHQNKMRNPKDFNCLKVGSILRFRVEAGQSRGDNPRAYNIEVK